MAASDRTLLGVESLCAARQVSDSHPRDEIVQEWSKAWNLVIPAPIPLSFHSFSFLPSKLSGPSGAGQLYGLG